MPDPKSAVLITDLDNTLYDFSIYYQAGLEAVVATIRDEFSLSSDQVVRRLREVYHRHGTIEYPFAIEEFPEVHNLPQGRRQLFARHVVSSFWVNATRRLEPYRTVRDTLYHLARQQVALIAYTDAPIVEAARRLRWLGFLGQVSGIVGQQWSRRKRCTMLLLMSDLPGHTRHGRKLVLRTSRDERKPSRLVYERIAHRLGSAAENITVIGDSIRRDLMPALELGCTVVWARYGLRDHATEGLLRDVVPDILPEVIDTKPEVPASVHIADRFEDVVAHLPVQQLLPAE